MRLLVATLAALSGREHQVLQAGIGAGSGVLAGTAGGAAACNCESETNHNPTSTLHRATRMSVPDIRERRESSRFHAPAR